MSQCLHCSKPCADHSVFCEECQEHAGELFQQEVSDQQAFPALSFPITPVAFTSQEGSDEGLPGSLFAPLEPAQSSLGGEFSQFSSFVPGADLSSADRTVSRLNAAARWMASEDLGGSHLKKRSHSSRLTPLHDISADIQRGSTPHPRQRRPSEFDTQPDGGELPDRQESQFPSGNLPDSWPWFAAVDEEEKAPDVWASSTDPLIARTRPTTREAAQIEEADIYRVQMEEHVTLPYPIIQPKQRRFSRWRVAFASMAILAVLALAVDGILLSFAFNQAKRGPSAQPGPPTLILSANVANSGDLISVQLAHFTPMTSVALTHDVQEILLTTGSVTSLTVDADGQARATFSVDSSWEPGFHLIVAEDVATRDTASAMLQIAGAGPSRPPHLLLGSASLDLGDAVQGADTLQPLELRNAGGGSIAWSASTNRPWLLVAPQQGMFSAGQSIAVAVQRDGLPPGDYSGTITISSTVGAPETIRVRMKVSALPPDAGPMISLAPPLLSFTTTDGSTAPATQVVTLSNPGQQKLYWSLNSGTTTNTMLQSTSSRPLPVASWLRADLTSGTLAPGASVRIHLTARSQSLLPGSYMEPLTFSSSRTPEAYDNPQVMDVALTVQPRCGLITSTGSLDFTAVIGQGDPSSHALSLNATSSCGNGTLDWRAFSSAGWLAVSPQNGQLKGTSTGVTSIGVNTTGLAAGRYRGLVTFQAGKNTQTVMVQLNLQPHPAPSEPIAGVSPSSLNFSTIQGQANPAGQVVTITNNGGSPLKWHAGVLLLGMNWLNVTPGSGTVLPGQTGQLTVNVATANLTPGSYTGQVTLAATNTRGAPASGSPQAISVSLVVQPPCTLAQPSASSLLFSGIAGGANPLAQTVVLTGAGSCSWPLHWSAIVAPATSWLTLSSSSGALDTVSQQASVAVGVNTSGLQPGTYSTQVKISAVDSAGTQAGNSPQSFAITLTVLQPCTLQALPSQVVLNAAASQSAPATHVFNLSETGSCSGGVAWTAATSNSPWLSLSDLSGTDTGNGSAITLSASASGLAPGNYTGQITISANNNGMVLSGSPQTIQVLFQVSGYTVSGTVAACGGPAPDCTVSQGLAGATVSLVSGNNVTVGTATANSAGDFTFTNIPPGTYTISAAGSNGLLSYSGTLTVTVNGNVSGANVSTFAS